jgi:hypothetical protein
MYTAKQRASSVPRHTSNHAKLLNTVLQSMIYDVQYTTFISVFIRIAC